MVYRISMSLIRSVMFGVRVAVGVGVSLYVLNINIKCSFIFIYGCWWLLSIDCYACNISILGYMLCTYLYLFVCLFDFFLFFFFLLRLPLSIFIPLILEFVFSRFSFNTTLTYSRFDWSPISDSIFPIYAKQSRK